MRLIVFTQGNCNIENLYPFSLTRRIQDFRIGALTIRQKWELSMDLASFDLKGESHLPENDHETGLKDIPAPAQVYLVQCNLLPSQKLLSVIKKMKAGEAIVDENGLILVQQFNKKNLDENGNLKLPVKQIVYKQPLLVHFFYELILLNRDALLCDLALLIKKKKTAAIDGTNGVLGRKNIFIERGAVVKHCILNAEEGPIFIDKNAVIMEGSCLRGPVYIGENTVVKMGTRIYGATAVGPDCTVGGEIKNTIFFGNSNKAHDGYLGDSVIGAWCNFGAGTSCSNLKNTVGDIEVNINGNLFKTRQKKMGVMMGDYSRTAINTSINTGTVIGVSAHVFGKGLTPKNIPNFSWGFDKKIKYELSRALKDAGAWKSLKGKQLTEKEEEILTNLYNKQK